jgi:hypothetical protein
MLICKKCNSEIQSLYCKEYICRDCFRKRWRENRRKRKDNGTLKVTKMSKEYYSKKNKEWSLNNKDKVRKYALEAKKRNPQKAKARMLLNSAVKSGKILKMNCQICNLPYSEAHHTNYEKPLEVIWLCRKHHIEQHKKEATEI